MLERDFTRNDLSPLPFIIGRKIASVEFETELRGNGLQNSGLTANAPVIARLFQACGYALTPNPAPSISNVFQVGDEATPVAWAESSGATASGTYTPSGNFSAGDVITIGTKHYTFVNSYTNTDGDVLLGGSEGASINNLIAAVNLGAGAGTVYAAAMTANPAEVLASLSGSNLVITSRSQGAAGNSIATTYTPSGSSEGAWGHATLQGGADVASNTDMIAYYLTVSSGGASGTAEVVITSDTAGEGSPAQALTSGSPLTVGTQGLALTPTWAGNLEAGQQWVMWLRPPGLSLDPISDNFQSVTLALHKDGVLHTVPGCFGTFQINAAAGNYATVKWTFTGTYQAPVDDPNPSPNFETELPSQVQLARLRINEFNAIVEKFTFDQKNDIQIRPDVSSSDGYIGTRIVSRKPDGGIDPEADLVANNDFWGQFAAAQRMPFQFRVGSAPGNTVWFIAPNTQYTGMTYGDRNGILVYDAGLSFARSVGNDECSLFFC